jgi:hypothetical protein
VFIYTNDEAFPGVKALDSVLSLQCDMNAIRSIALLLHPGVLTVLLTRRMAFEMPATSSMLDFGGRSKMESHFLNRLLAHGVMLGSSLVNAPKSVHGFAFQSPPEHEIIVVQETHSFC